MSFQGRTALLSCIVHSNVLSLAVPRWKRVTCDKKGDDPKTDLTKGTTRTPGWQPEETEALTAKAGYDCLNNATVEKRPDAVGWAPSVWQARWLPPLRGLWVSGLLPPYNGGPSPGR